MKKTLMTIKQTAMLHKLAVLGVAVAGVFVYMTDIAIPRGWFSYYAQFPALCILAVTALARVNDIRPERTAWIWQLRRVGLSFTGVAAVSYLMVPMSAQAIEIGAPSWKSVLLAWGMALAWISDPNQPPFWKYVSGETKLPKAST